MHSQVLSRCLCQQQWYLAWTCCCPGPLLSGLSKVVSHHPRQFGNWVSRQVHHSSLWALRQWLSLPTAQTPPQGQWERVGHLHRATYSVNKKQGSWRGMCMKERSGKKSRGQIMDTVVRAVEITLIEMGGFSPGTDQIWFTICRGHSGFRVGNMM